MWKIRDIRCPYRLGDFVYKMNEPKDYEHLLLCDGSTISEENYPDLVELLGGTQLPNLIGRVLQGDSVGGEYKEAGLPNIWGSIDASAQAQTLEAFGETYPVVTGAFKDIRGAQCATVDAGITGSMMRGFTFNAAQCSTVYKDINTVQPPAYTTKIYICYAG